MEEEFKVVIFIEEYSEYYLQKILHLLSNQKPEKVSVWNNCTKLDSKLANLGYNVLSEVMDDEEYMIVSESILKQGSNWYRNYHRRKHLKKRIIKNEF